MSIKGYCTFYKNLYIGESIKNPVLVKWKLKHGAGQLSIFVVSEAQNENDQLEIEHCSFLKQKYYRKHPLLIYGIAGSYKEALDIVLRISEDSHMYGMDGNLIGFLRKVSGE